MRKNCKLIEVDFDKLIHIFNTDGKKAAVAYVESTYGVAYAQIQKRISKETNYVFNRNSRKYEEEKKNKNPFMTMAELCQDQTTLDEKIAVEKATEIPQKDNRFENIILDLMKDRMLEMNKYIYLEQSSKQIIINLKLLKDHGYEVMIN